MANFVFKGIQQVKALPSSPEKGVLYFVREFANGEATGNMSVYFGSRCYGKVEETRLAKIEDDILALDGRVGDIEDALGNWVSLGKDLETVAKVVANHESRIVTAEGNASAAVATANSAKTIADEAKQIAEDAVTDVTEQVNAAKAAQTAAAGSASAADASAQAAAGSAADADASAQDAAGSASAAAQSAANAEDAKGAAQSAQTAADASAQAAAGSASAAETAKAGAEAAKGAAESAKEAAVAAKEAAEASNTSATAIANEAKDIATSANTVAGEAKSTAAQALETAQNAVANLKTYTVKKLSDSEVTNLGDTNVREAYQIIDEDNSPAGETIKIYKDSSLKKVELSGQSLQFTYILADGNEDTVGVDVSSFLAESEFGDGLQVVEHVVSVKKDASSESFLSVSSDGVKISGIQNAINTAASNTLTAATGYTDEKISGVNETIASIQSSLSNVNVKSDDKTVVITKTEDKAEFDVAVNTKVLSDDEKTAGYIEFLKDNNGALYGVMYYGGDDAE